MAADFSRRSGPSTNQARASGIVRIVWAVSVLAITAVLLIIGQACLPDLAALPPIPETSTPSTNSVGCGDGLIEILDDGGDAGESCDPGNPNAPVVGDAQAAGCERCQFICPGVRDDAGGHCYFQTIDTTTYANAVSACSSVGAHVVTFASDRELALASSIVGETNAFWVGLTLDNITSTYHPPIGAKSEPGWPKPNTPCSGCFGVGANDAGEFAVNPEHVDASAFRPCVISKNNSWFQAECEPSLLDGGVQQKFATICEREPVGQRAHFCGGPFCTTVSATIGSKRYVIVLDTVLPDKAREVCEASYEDGGLVVLSSREEREQLAREIQALAGPGSNDKPVSVWIGLSLKSSQWTWDDGQAEDAGLGRPFVWGGGQPGNGLGRAYLRIVDGEFDSQLVYAEDGGHQAKLRGFVCQRR